MIDQNKLFNDTFLKQAAITLVLILCLSFTISSTWADTPNVIFILADDMGIGDLGVYNQNYRAQLDPGLPRIFTPNIDSLATNGVRFTDMHSNPMCGPSRSTLQCGFHQGHAKVDRNQGGSNPIQPSEYEKTWAQVLQDANYTTAIFGRWHLRGMPKSGLNGSSVIVDINSTPVGKGYQEAWANYTYRDQWVWEDTGVGGMIIQEQPLSSEYFTETGWNPHPDDNPADQVYTPLDLTNRTLDFIDAHYQDPEPFMAFMSFYAVHVNTQEIPTYGQYGGLGWTAANASYAATLTYMDEMVGRILDKLRDPDGDTDQSDSILHNTLIVFTSDNGSQNDHDISFFGSTDVYKDNGDSIVEASDFIDLRGQKFSVTEGGTHTPFIVMWTGNPNIIPNSTFDGMCTFSDWLPTLAEMTGADAPLGTDGYSFWKDLNGQVSERPDFRISRNNDWSIAMGEWKLIRDIGDSDPFELYHLPTNPEEIEDNQINNRPDIEDALRTIALDEWVESDSGSGSNSNDYFCQFKEWAPVDGSGDFYDATNWTGGVSHVEYDAGLPAINHLTGPAENWIPTINNNTVADTVIEVSLNTDLQAMEVMGDTNQMILNLGPGKRLQVRNGLRVHTNGAVHLGSCQLKTLRDIEIKQGGELTGHGRITGCQELITGIPEFAGQGFLEPHLFNSGYMAPGTPDELQVPLMAPETFDVIEHFNALALGPIGGQNGWSSVGTTSQHAVAANGNIQCLNIDASSSTLTASGKSLAGPVANNTTATLFARIRSTGIDVDGWIGLTDTASVSATWSDYEVQIGIKSTNMEAKNTGTSTTVVSGIEAGSWYNVWVIINNATDTFDVYVNDGANDATINDRVANDFVFRNSGGGAVNNELPLFRAMSAKSKTDDFQVDDIYIDLTGENLSNPAPVDEIPPEEIDYEDPNVILDSTGLIVVEGNFTQSEDGILAIDLGGTDNSDPLDVDYDAIIITGTAVLAGDLTVSLADGFIPTNGDSFTIVTAGAISGTFDLLNDIVATPDGFRFKVSYTATTVTLTHCSGKADFDCTGLVDMDDLEYMVSVWLTSDSTVNIAPDPLDNIVNLEDFIILSQEWFE